jgi:tRNA(Arg) A34 adenosine deaminase TadA
MEPTSFELSLPDWLDTFLRHFTFPLKTLESRMRFVIVLSRENICRKTGGPFGAAVFNAHTNELISCGVNRVVPLNCSIAHAEMIALSLAQKRLSSFNLSDAGLPDLELVTSTEPCAMCLGAIPWSGIRKLVCGANDADARKAGFDEGCKPNDWQNELERCKISFITSVCREEAAEVLREYAKSGGIIYNGAKKTD